MASTTGKGPIFIIANPRSGSSLLRLMLTCHQNICVPPECGFAVWLHDDYKDWQLDDISTRLEGFLDDLYQSRKFETWKLPREMLTERIHTAQPRSYANLVESVYQSFAIFRDGRCVRWGDKNNHYLNSIDLIKELFPEVHFIHIVRDVRDVACSYMEVGSAAIDSEYRPRLPSQLKEIAREWQENMETIGRSFANMAMENVSEIRFEDLVAHPESILSELSASIGEPFDPQMLSYHERNREQELEPTEFLQWKAKTRQPPDSSRVQRFREELSASDLDSVVAIARHGLQTYNYLEEG